MKKLIAILEIPERTSGAESCSQCIFNYNTNKEGFNGCGSINAAYGKFMHEDPDECFACSEFDFKKGNIKFITVIDEKNMK